MRYLAGSNDWCGKAIGTDKHSTVRGEQASRTPTEVRQHPSDIELQRLADDGVLAVGAGVLAHVRECPTCANLVRYARAVPMAIRESAVEEPPAGDLLRHIIRAVTGVEPLEPRDSLGDSESRS